MLCDECRERAAAVNLTQIVDNAVTQLHLCERCAAERGVETSVAAPQHPLGAFLQAVQNPGLPVAAGPETARCSFCGTTLRDFRATGRLGCAGCYVTFERSLRELLRRVHGSSRHVGRGYRLPEPERLEKAALLGELRERLRRAIDAEQFEQAASLRDRIRGLE